MNVMASMDAPPMPRNRPAVLRLHHKRLDAGLDFQLQGDDWGHESERRTLQYLDTCLELLLRHGCPDLMALRARAEAVVELVSILRRHGRHPCWYQDTSKDSAHPEPVRVPY